MQRKLSNGGLNSFDLRLFQQASIPVAICQTTVELGAFVPI